jgi:threonine/homoserine/homoserine lactone efflux protein
MQSGLIGFSVVALFLVMSPGVNTMLIVNNASNFGPRIAGFNIAGLCTATFFHGALSIFGISVVVLSSPSLYLAVKMVGGLYLAYIGARMLWTGITILGCSTPRGYAKPGASGRKSPVESFKEGFLTQLFNPKVSMFYLAAFPQFITGADTVYEGFSLVLVHASIIASWFCFLTYSISFMKRKLEQPAVQSTINIVTGVVLLAFSALLFAK